MAKKSRKRESNHNNKKSKEKCKPNANKNESKKLSDFTYAELIVLSSTLSYSIGEELDDDDFTIFVVFLGLLIAELQLIVTQKTFNNKNQSDVSEEELDIEDIDVDY